MSDSQLAERPATDTFIRASTALSQQLGLEPRAMIDAIKTQFFKGKEATDAQLAVVVSTARALGLNPLLPGQLYPYPDRSGSVTIMLGPDGIFTLLANNPDIVSQKDGGPAYYVEHGKDGDKETCTGYVNHRTKGLLKKTIWVDEWVVSTNPNWSARRHHMAEIRALKQAARMVVHGIPPDSDEHRLGEMLNVTDSAEDTPPIKRAEPKPRAKTGAASVQENVTPPITAKPEPKPTGSVVEGELMPGDPTQSPVVQEAREEKANPPATESPPPAPAQRAMLAPDERLGVNAKVVSLITGFSPKDNCSVVQAKVDGGYYGEVHHFGGAALPIGEADPVPNPIWTVGNTLYLKLVGYKLKSGKVQARVESAELAKPSIETE